MVPIDLSMTYNKQNYMSRVEQPKQMLQRDRDQAALDGSPFRSGISLGGTVTAKSIRINRAATNNGLEIAKSNQFS